MSNIEKKQTFLENNLKNACKYQIKFVSLKCNNKEGETHRKNCKQYDLQISRRSRKRYRRANRK